MTPTHKVMTIIQHGTYQYHDDIGVAWLTENGDIEVKLTSLPINGQLKVSPLDEK